ncbi:MAG TPA: hypothetical protein PLL71_17885, partial [Agriterribacter sp.]|nr:hypothetical protein [Agriterribacter sp.]
GIRFQCQGNLSLWTANSFGFRKFMVFSLLLYSPDLELLASGLVFDFYLVLVIWSLALCASFPHFAVVLRT